MRSAAVVRISADMLVEQCALVEQKLCLWLAKLKLLNTAEPAKLNSILLACMKDQTSQTIGRNILGKLNSQRSISLEERERER